MPRILDTRTEPDAAIDAAVAAITAGECIVLPTDTVYGIAANAFDADAVERLLNAKQRGRDMPPPVLVADPHALPALADEVGPDLETLAEAFWPGPLTVVVNAQPSLRIDLGERGQTIAVRIPAHEFTRELLRATGPLAVSSANVSGQPAATTIEEARDQLEDTVSVYLDGGPAGANVPSTIVDLTGESPRILREGVLTRDQLAEHLLSLAEG